MDWLDHDIEVIQLKLLLIQQQLLYDQSKLKSKAQKAASKLGPNSTKRAVDFIVHAKATTDFRPRDSRFLSFKRGANVLAMQSHQAWLGEVDGKVGKLADFEFLEVQPNNYREALKDLKKDMLRNYENVLNLFEHIPDGTNNRLEPLTDEKRNSLKEQFKYQQRSRYSMDHSFDCSVASTIQLVQIMSVLELELQEKMAVHADCISKKEALQMSWLTMEPTLLNQKKFLETAAVEYVLLCNRTLVNPLDSLEARLLNYQISGQIGRIQAARDNCMVDRSIDSHLEHFSSISNIESEHKTKFELVSPNGLMLACKSGCLSLVHYILDSIPLKTRKKFTRANEKSSGLNALHLAVLTLNKGVLKALLTFGFDSRSSDQGLHRANSLHYAVALGSTELSTVLLAHYCKLDVDDRSRYSSFALQSKHHMPCTGSLDIVKHSQFDNQPNTTATSSSESTSPSSTLPCVSAALPDILHQNAEIGPCYWDPVRQSADASTSCPFSHSNVSHNYKVYSNACKSPCSRIAKSLLDQPTKGASLRLTPLQIACVLNQIECAQFLIGAKADISATCISGGCIYGLSQLSKQDLNTSTCDHTRSPLSLAILNRNMTIVQTLLEGNAQVSSAESSEIMIAALSQRALDIVDLLIAEETTSIPVGKTSTGSSNGPNRASSEQSNDDDHACEDLQLDDVRVEGIDREDLEQERKTSLAMEEDGGMQGSFPVQILSHGIVAGVSPSTEVCSQLTGGLSKGFDLESSDTDKHDLGLKMQSQILQQKILQVLTGTRMRSLYRYAHTVGPVRSPPLLEQLE